MTETNRLQVRDLDKSFGEESILSAVSFDVAEDEIVALLGPSGCGKTTTLRCIAGVESPDGGEITIDGETVYSSDVSHPPEDREIGMVYQNYAIWPHKSVYENVVFPLKYADHSFSKDEYESRVDWLLELVDIAELKHQPATDLSGGQQQRTALARALAHDPDLLLLDEPLSNLDKKLRANMRYELQKLQQEVGVSMLYVTHDQEEAFYLADKVLVMNEGDIVERGAPRELYRRPSSAFTRDFVGQWNRLDGSVEWDSDGSRVVRTDLGTVPVDAVDVVHSANVDGPVHCFLRPRDAAVQRESAADGGRAAGTDGIFVGADVVGAGDAPAALSRRGTVLAAGLSRDLYEVTVGFEDADTEVVVRSDRVRDFDRGDRVLLRAPADAIKLYSAGE
ncbi:iron(III) transport system ATP-binding protein [Halalkaliarchaeum desulfuricum]|uniref:Molybdate/tungstate import ATP-binding protein WtpC n=1 Tax=Halalkaliarchaeum desulfuricum TaxID=2055893 RepID=A0A343TG17_9EURY|nr:ABC transporter ATP-binding protein [Halalkaliarchaeum desulfuricum]AUX08039.1 iron(III) transport system ATP-binding protein [Halalkaliarchaeum desulfuricum]